MTFKKKPLNKTIRTFYGFGDLGFSLMTSVELFFFVFFLTNVAKFSLPMVALIGTVTSVVDAILSPFYGAIIAGTKPLKWGRNRSWMLIAPPAVFILYMFQYTRIGPSELISAIIVSIGFILSHIIWNLAWVANVSLIPTLANNPEERGLLSSRRATWTAVAGLFFSYIAAPLALWYGEITGNVNMGYTLLAGTMAFIMMLAYWTVFAITKGYEATGEEEAAMAKASPQKKVSLGGMLKSAAQNPPLLVLLLADFFRYMSFFIITASVAYYFNYIGGASLLKLGLFVGALAAFVGSYLSGFMIQKFSTRTTSIIGLFVASVTLIIGSFVGMNLILFFVVATISRAFLGALSASMVALYTDCAVYAEWKTGEDAKPFVMGLMNISLKAAIISRGTVIPLVLGLAGFDASIDPAAATEAVKQAVLTVNMLIPGIFALIGGLVLFVAYKLTRDKVAELQSEIDARSIKTAKKIA